MKATTIVLIAAAPVALLLWLLRRRKRPGVNTKSSDRTRIETGNLGGDNSVRVVETERAQEPAFREKLPEPNEKRVLESSGSERAAEQPAAPAAAAVQLQTEIERPAEDIAESYFSDEPPLSAQAAVIEFAISDAIATALSSPPTQEDEIAAEDFVPSSINGQNSIEVTVNLPTPVAPTEEIAGSCFSNEPPPPAQTAVIESPVSERVPTAQSREPTQEAESVADDFVPSSINRQDSLEVPVDLAAPAVPFAAEDLEHEQNGLAPETDLTGMQAAQLVQTNGDAGYSPVIEPPPDDDESDAAKLPQRYRPPPQRPPGQTARPPVNREPKRAGLADVLLGISVQLKFDRSGFCETALLPERRPDLDDEVAVTFGRKSLRLFAQEDFHEPQRRCQRVHRFSPAAAAAAAVVLFRIRLPFAFSDGPSA